MRKSAGILAFRRNHKALEVFLVHPGGPFWKGKDAGAWSIPKGEFSGGEEPFDAAVREFREETGFDISGDFIELNTIQQKSGKLVFGWAVETDIDADQIVSNTFQQEWPYRSGRYQTFSEVDQAGWFDLETARNKINPAQVQLLDDLMGKIK